MKVFFMGILHSISQKIFKTILPRPVLVIIYKAFFRRHLDYDGIVSITPSTENLSPYNTMLKELLKTKSSKN